MLSLTRDEALRRFTQVVVESGMGISPGSGAGYVSTGPVTYPDQPAIVDYYNSDGLPIITYYEPPSTYYYLYSWVPYPFWYGGTAFAGYYIRTDHHHHGHASHTKHYGTGRSYQGNPGYDSRNEREKRHYPGRSVNPGPWSREVPHGMIRRPTSAPTVRVGASSTPVRPMSRQGSGRSQRMMGSQFPDPSTTQSSTRTETRFSSPRIVSPSPSPSGSVSIRRGSSSGKGLHRPSGNGWSRGTGGQGSAGHGYAGFRR